MAAQTGPKTGPDRSPSQSWSSPGPARSQLPVQAQLVRSGPCAGPGPALKRVRTGTGSNLIRLDTARLQPQYYREINSAGQAGRSYASMRCCTRSISASVLSSKAFIPRRTGCPCDAAGASKYVRIDPHCNAANVLRRQIRSHMAAHDGRRMMSHSNTDANTDVQRSWRAAIIFVTSAVQGPRACRGHPSRRAQICDEGRDRELI